MEIITADVAGGTLYLGHQGENLATRICFSTTSWREAYGDGTFQLIHRRAGDTAPYPVTVTVDGETLYWDVSDSDTAASGTGCCELQYFAGDTLAKSQVWLTRVTPALAPAGSDPPAPYQSWVDEVLAAGTAAAASAERAEAAAIRQPKIGSDGSWWVWDAAAGTYADTGTRAIGGGVLSDDVDAIVILNRADYDALSEKNAKTLYLIRG